MKLKISFLYHAFCHFNIISNVKRNIENKSRFILEFLIYVGYLELYFEFLFLKQYG